MNPDDIAELARAVVNRFGDDAGLPAADVTSLAAFPVLAAIYALADGGTGQWISCFYEIALHRRELIQLPEEDAPRDVLVFMDVMINSHEYGVDVATGEVILVCDASYLSAPTLDAFLTTYAEGGLI